MKTFFDDYQAFTRTTAVYPEVLSLPYLALGLCDEAGELAEKVAAYVAYTSDKGHPPRGWDDQVLAEAGDVIWYVARITDHMDHPLSDVVTRANYKGDATLVGIVIATLVNAARVAGRCKKMLRDGDTWSEDQKVAAERVITESLFEVVGGVESLARALGGTLVGVMKDNQQKLADRLSRNVIKGDGDNR